MNSPAQAASVARRDPFASALAESPYNRLPAVQPDDDVRAILRVQQCAQRGGLGEHEDAAFRALRDVTTRLTWDLLTLGTTPGIPKALWFELESQLARGDRRAARALFLGVNPEMATPEATHVRAIIAANEVGRAALAPGETELEAALSGFVAGWAALLARPQWLVAFARARVGVWNRGGAYVVLDAADELRLPERLEQLLLELLARATSGDTEQQRRWRLEWERERVAIEAMGKACRQAAAPGSAPKGFGPRGLAELGKLTSLAAALRPERDEQPPLPLTKLRAGEVTLEVAEGRRSAVAALHLLYGPLGIAASQVWTGAGVLANALLPRSVASSEATTWFASKEEEAGALRGLRFEAWLQVLRDELSRVDVPVPQVVGTAQRLLDLCARSKDVGVLREAIERKVLGRAVSCIEAEGLPQPGELRHVLALCTELRALLARHGGGELVAGALAQLLVRRAGTVWQRYRGLPRPADRHRVLRDLFRANELAPHNADIAESIVAVVVQLYDSIESRGEAQDLLRRVLECLQACQQHVPSHRGLRDARRRLEELLDPEQSLGRTWGDVKQILESNADGQGGRRQPRGAAE